MSCMLHAAAHLYCEAEGADTGDWSVAAEHQAFYAFLLVGAPWSDSVPCAPFIKLLDSCSTCTTALSL